jgi:ketosteroid isomerase-like protein
MHAFRAAVEAQDLGAMSELMADDIVFHSPFAFRPFVGRESVTGVLTGVMSTFEEFSYSDELEDGDTATLIFNAKVGDKKVQGLDLVRTNADGKIKELTVMLRPASALMAMGEAMAPKVDGLAKGDAPK